MFDTHAITASIMFKVSPEEVTPDQRAAGKEANYRLLYTARQHLTPDEIKYMLVRSQLRASLNRWEQAMDRMFFGFDAAAGPDQTAVHIVDREV